MLLEKSMHALRFLMIFSVIITLIGCTQQPLKDQSEFTKIEFETKTPEIMTPTIKASVEIKIETTDTPISSITSISKSTITPRNTSKPEQVKVQLTPSPTLAMMAVETGQEWQELPVIPEISDEVVSIYRRGIELGNNPQAFSKIGDCGSTPTWFLGDFDLGPDFYRLGEYKNLADVIQEFQGSFNRTSLAARSGFTTSSLFTPLWSDRTFCESNEPPLACEYRLNKPVIAFIMLGTNDVWHPERFEPQMREIIEISIENGVIPILSTKVDNQEGDWSINAIIADLADEYEIPLWNFWGAVNFLPNRGMQPDNAHLTWGRNFFDDPEAMKMGWPVRNLTALQVLDAIWQKVRTR